MTGRNRLTDRGADAKAPAKLPALQAVRAGASPQEIARALESLREWVEVRLGARGDAFERALTLREFQQQIRPIQAQLDALGDFDGSLESVAATPDALPTDVVDGTFRATTDGKLYFGVAGVWKQVTLT